MWIDFGKLSEMANIKVQNSRQRGKYECSKFAQNVWRSSKSTKQVNLWEAILVLQFLLRKLDMLTVPTKSTNTAGLYLTSWTII